MASTPPFLSSHSKITAPFLSTLESTTANLHDDPNYYAKSPRDLLSECTPHFFTTGTGSAIYDSLTPLLESTSQELILVTCFWAKSSSLSTLNNILRKLSLKAIHRGTTKIRIRLCFSSLSLFQKLFHKQSVTGQEYGPDVWVNKLGLPPPEDLGGLDLKVKSVFILPFSVMHPKFMIIDRQTVILPSCNISWEEWFEGAITFSGPLVSQFLTFYSSFWERRPELPALENSSSASQTAPAPNTTTLKPTSATATATGTRISDSIRAYTPSHLILSLSIPHRSLPALPPSIPSIFLPSPHHRSPRFQPFTSSANMYMPPTPLNAFTLTLLSKAEKRIRIQTPNLTSPPILSALLKALERGVDVHITTSEKLMVLEQLVTAGTTTSRCVKKLVKRYKKLSHPQRPVDEESALSSFTPGRLSISYFEPTLGYKARGEEAGNPQQSHIKLMIVDAEVLVLGSGNMDRASTFTSQELGVAFLDRGLAGRVEAVLGAGDMGGDANGRGRVVFDSAV